MTTLTVPITLNATISTFESRGLSQAGCDHVNALPNDEREHETRAVFADAVLGIRPEYVSSSWGVRVDVDGLGTIFSQNGFTTEKEALAEARYAVRHYSAGTRGAR